ncbi:cytochrome b [Rickettsia australis str. Cutlack]|uniref:Cytochrome b n=1 Tax=Rickettsia australis (strain Cutlack) TaxID=1105110 RepID=H8K882_RICAC|nr:cytochrome b [Rickettsia australis str. Cutlack]
MNEDMTPKKPNATRVLAKLAYRGEVEGNTEHSTAV